MTTVQTPRSNRRTKTPGDRATATLSPLSTLYERQQDAVEAARAKGVHEVEVSFRIPGAKFVAKVKVDDLEQVSALRRSRKSKTLAKHAALVPTEKVRKAIEEAKDVTVFYKTPQELFDALEKQD